MEPARKLTQLLCRFLGQRRFGIRAQLLVALTTLLLLPLLGFEYWHEADHFLRDGQQRALRLTAQSVATALTQRSDVFVNTPEETAQPEPPEKKNSIFLVDPPALLPTQPLVSTPSLSLPEELAHSISITDQLEQALTPMVPPNVRLWVLNRHMDVLVRIGSLHRAIDETPPPPFSWRHPLQWIDSRIVAPLFRIFAPAPTEDFLDDPPMVVYMMQEDVVQALAGDTTQSRRFSEDGAAEIIVVTTPIRSNGQIVGVAIVEETTNGLMATRNAAFERLFLMLIGVIFIIVLVLTLYATILARRVRTLRDEVEQAVDARGHLRHHITQAHINDEVGDLSRSFGDVLGRLEEAAVYREQMASRLSHELRTPIAVVRTSLENLSEPLPNDEQNKYLARAQSGLTRLSQLLARMTEATRLEQSIVNAEISEIDWATFLTTTVEGYRQAYPNERFNLRLPKSDDTAPKRLRRVAPDLIVQLLDKLVANAEEFAAPNTVIDISLQLTDSEAIIRVTNEGPLPPDGDTSQLFEPMISKREGKRTDTPHLGLGLYIVRLIAEYHNGHAKIAARDDALGTVVTVTLGECRSDDRKQKTEDRRHTI